MHPNRFNLEFARPLREAQTAVQPPAASLLDKLRYLQGPLFLLNRRGREVSLIASTSHLGRADARPSDFSSASLIPSSRNCRSSTSAGACVINS